MTSPLSEASPQALEELFSRNPLALAEDDAAIDALVAYYRAQRERWLQSEATAKRRPPKEKLNVTDLADLGL